MCLTQICTNFIEFSLDLFDMKDVTSTLLSEYDYTRAVRMASYGFLLYGPGSYAWYQFLDHCMPQKNVQNLTTKVNLISHTSKSKNVGHDL